MPESIFLRALDWPPLYRTTQAVLAPGAHGLLSSHLRRTATNVRCSGLILDVGCGPTSWLTDIGMRPIGLDLTFSYTSDLKSGGLQAVCGSATDLPFPDNSLSCVWSIGLLHHLTDDMARAAIKEMVRVTQPAGTIILFDGLLPAVSARPLIWLLRRLDRGRYMRSQLQLESLLDGRVRWSCARVGYSLIGHEGIFCIAKRSSSQYE